MEISWKVRRAYAKLTIWLQLNWPRVRIGLEPGTRGARFIQWFYGPTATLCEGFWTLLGLGLKKVFGRPAHAAEDFFLSRSKIVLIFCAADGVLLFLLYVGQMAATFMEQSSGRVRYESWYLYQIVLWPWIILGIILATVVGVLLITLFVRFASKHLCPVLFYIKEHRDQTAIFNGETVTG